MEKFENIVRRIKGILCTIESAKHNFTIISGGCTDCSAFPNIEFEGDCGSVEEVYYDTADGKVKVKGRTEWDEFDVSIEELSYSEICVILNTMEEQLGMELSPTFRKNSFSITSVCREDIAALGYKGAENIPDSVMEKIAEKMADDYIENSFWIKLDYFVGEYCGLEQEYKCEDED